MWQITKYEKEDMTEIEGKYDSATHNDRRSMALSI